MSKKYFVCLLSIFLFPFLFLGDSHAQDNTPVEQASSEPKGVFPGMPPSGKRWVPGHYEVVDGQNKRVPGHYESVEGDSPTPPTVSPRRLPTAEQQSDSTTLPTRGGGRLFPGGKPTGKARQWIPRHFEEVEGKKIYQLEADKSSYFQQIIVCCSPE